MISHIFLTVFKILSLLLSFNKLIRICISVHLCVYPSWESLRFLRCRLMFLSNLGSFQTTIFKFFQVFRLQVFKTTISSSSLSVTIFPRLLGLPLHIYRYVCQCLIGITGSVNFLSLFFNSVLQTGLFQLIHLQDH